ncbi:MAG: RagB/SusD family nutrient uptake outer membrane protein [Arachidicoccus sp.]|nr:RagB/SusD family nutrient uptake outer membrane protein [Arachidicoccus sp.]
MKNKIVYTFLLLVVLVSCKKSFLDLTNPNGPTLDNYYATADQVQGATAFLYNQPWSSYIDKAFNCIGDILSGNMLSSAGDANYGNNSYVYFTVQATDGNNLLAWQANYKVAGNATVLMTTFQQKLAAATAEQQGFLNEGIAEAQFIRGAAYFNIARVWGDVPIIADPIALASATNYNIPRYQQKDVLQFALNDFKAAFENLPADPIVTGRASKYSAEGMMAKLYLYRGDYDSAAAAAKDVIESGKYALFSDYLGMFTNPNNNNNSESLFALQWIAQGGYGYANAEQAYCAPASLLKPDFNTGYSSVIPSLDLINAYDFGDKRKGWSIMQEGYTNPNWKNVNFPNGFVYDTMPGGQQDDATHITTGTRSNVLKYVIGPADNNGANPFPTNSQGGNSMCTYMLRYADVLLIYAEAVLGTNASTADGDALAAFNQVHQRAGLTAVTSLTKDLILHERRVEFAFEGDYWFDIQRQGFAKAKQIMEAQERGTLNGDGTVNHTGVTVSSASQLFLPIPSSEITADPELAKPAVPYY